MHFIAKQQESPLDVQEMITRSVAGDHNGQRSLFIKYATPMSRLSLRYLHNADDAEEAVMDGFEKVFRHLSGFRYDGDQSLFNWIRRIVVNECLMKIRKKQKSFFMDISLYNHSDSASVKTDNSEDIVELIKTLPIGYRTVFNMFVIDGYSHSEIAEMLGITESASRSQLTHARTKLKALVRKHGW